MSLKGIVPTMNLKFYRHATFLMAIDGQRILVDPMYAERGSFLPIPSTLKLRRNPLERFPEDYPTISDQDLLLITHHHFDHFDRLAARSLTKDLPVITPANGSRRLRKMGFSEIHPLRPGQECLVKGFRILAVPAKPAQRFAWMLYQPGLGYLLESSKGRLYISGDTVLDKDLMDVLKRYRIDLAIFFGGAARIPLLGRHTLSAAEIGSLINDIRPATSIIAHLDGLNHCTEGRQTVGARIGSTPLPTSVILPCPGDEFTFDAP